MQLLIYQKLVCYLMKKTCSYPFFLGYYHEFTGAHEAIHYAEGTLYFTALIVVIHYNKPSVVDSAKVEEYSVYLRKAIVVLLS